MAVSANGEITYIVTDAEFDGPAPGVNSMLAFGSVAVKADGTKLGEFETVLERLEGATTHPDTDKFWQQFPEAYAAATLNPESPELVMKKFVAWIKNLPGEPVFVAHPVMLDGPWIDFYLKKYTDEELFEGQWRTDRLFRASPFCLWSFAAGRLGWPPEKCDVHNYLPEWLGNHEHTHRAIDDARGYASFLTYLMNYKTEKSEK